jgi:hypothetical protein
MTGLYFKAQPPLPIEACMELHDVLAVLILVASIIAAALKFGLAIRKRTERAVYAIIGVFLLYFAGFYTYLLLCDPPITDVTATLGRAGILLIVVGLIMQAIVRW